MGGGVERDRKLSDITTNESDTFLIAPDKEMSRACLSSRVCFSRVVALFVALSVRFQKFSNIFVESLFKSI